MIARTALDELLAAGLEYAAEGRMLVPIDGKVPVIPGADKRAGDPSLAWIPNTPWAATSDPDMLRRYFEWHAETGRSPITGLAQLCGPLSGVEVLDRDGGNAEALLEKAGWPLSRLIEAGVPIVKSGREGHWHAHFLPDPEGRVGAQQVEGLDFKGGNKALSTLPPSLHMKSGRQYEWLQRGQPCPWPEELLDLLPKVAPAPTVPLLEVPRSRIAGIRFGDNRPGAVERARAYMQHMPPAVAGQGGHNQTFAVAMALAEGFALTHAETLGLLTEYNERCEPPWTQRELEHKASEAMKRAAASPKLGHLLEAQRDFVPRNGRHRGNEAPGHEAEVQAVEAQGEEQPKSLRFLTPAQVLAMAEAKPREWLVDGLLPFGAVVLVTGVEKEAGKSSFVWSIIGAAERGEEFVGHVLPKTPAVVLTEESVWDVAEKLRVYGVTRASILPQGEAWNVSMERAVDEAMRAAEATGARILVVDTFAAWAALEGDAENKAGVAQALKPLQRARDAGLLVLLVHHTSKNKEAEGIRRNRGSTALTGAVEASLEVARHGETTRTLRLVSRYAGSKSWLVDRARNEAGLLTYKFLGNKEEVQKASAEDSVHRWLESNKGWHSLDEIALRAGGQNSLTKAAVRQLYKDGRLRREGKGRPGDPHMYAVAGEESPPPHRHHAQAEVDRIQRNLHGTKAHALPTQAVRAGKAWQAPLRGDVGLVQGTRTQAQAAQDAFVEALLEGESDEAATAKAVEAGRAVMDRERAEVDKAAQELLDRMGRKPEEE